MEARAQTPASDDPVQVLQVLDRGFTAIFNRVAPAVVIIDASKQGSEFPEDHAKALEFFLQEPDGPEGESFDLPRPPDVSEGSGFIVREDGYIVTNEHVIADALQLTVRMKDGRRFPATLVGRDDKTDIAVLKIEATGLPAVEFADSEEVEVGQLVCSIGVPFSLDYSFSCGWVSGKSRSKLTDIAYEDYIQTDAFINPGNSGGPLLDVNGRVIGMNTLINGIGRGLAFAIPSNMLREVSTQLIETGKVVRPWLGVRIETFDEDSAFHSKVRGVEAGVVVATIVAGTPASRSDLRQSDVITKVDSVIVKTDRELQKEILKKRVGQTVELTVWRDGAFREVQIVTGEQPSTLRQAANKKNIEKPEKKNERTEEEGGLNTHQSDSETNR